ncbi:MAG TPA: hypothetical protein PL037_03830 [Elusimicrobiales bacterium]|nr:hypothetical protein [Elusimicrobiales bacterium]
MKDFRRRFWIRRDRERFFLIGFLLASIIASFTTTWWNFSDRIKSEGRVVMPKTQNITKQKEAELLREERLSPGGSKLLEIGRALEASDPGGE